MHGTANFLEQKVGHVHPCASMDFRIKTVYFQQLPDEQKDQL